MELSNYFIKLVSGPDHGRLELTTAPGKAVSEWTQGALELGILQYQHQTMDESSADQFTFVVSDGLEDIYKSFLLKMNLTVSSFSVYKFIVDLDSVSLNIILGIVVYKHNSKKWFMDYG